MKRIFILIFIMFCLYVNAYNNESQPYFNVKTYKIPDFTGILLTQAETWLGTKYVYGGISRRGVDCSAFVRNVVKDSWNVQLPRTSREQFKYTTPIDKKDIQDGDLVFFSNSKGIHHVGIIYELDKNDIKFIHAASSKGVSISSLNKGYWAKQRQKYGRIFL